MTTLALAIRIDTAIRDLQRLTGEYGTAQETAITGRETKLIAQNELYDAKQPAIDRLIFGGVTKTDAPKRVSEDPEYARLEHMLQVATRLSDRADVELSKARARMQTQRAILEALTALTRTEGDHP